MQCQPSRLHVSSKSGDMKSPLTNPGSVLWGVSTCTHCVDSGGYFCGSDKTLVSGSGPVGEWPLSAAIWLVSFCFYLLILPSLPEPVARLFKSRPTTRRAITMGSSPTRSTATPSNHDAACDQVSSSHPASTDVRSLCSQFDDADASLGKCRIKKIRCSRQHPRCLQCHQSQLDCSWTNKGKKPNQTKKL